MKNYKKKGFVFQKNQTDMETIDYFLIDANCLIHPVCFKVIAENPDLQDNDKLEDKMINSVLEYLDKLINYVNPAKGVYLAIDGVAPVAKIKQQRSRRFKSVADKIMWDNIKKKYSKPITSHWNNNAITPGTVFMEKLHKNILNWMNLQEKHIIYSSCFTPAEGEHKLLNFIRNNQQNDIDMSYVVYGLDADLIFLALSTESDRIYLLREANEINRKESNEILTFVNIKIMKESIVNTIYDYLKKSTNEYIYSIFNDLINNCLTIRKAIKPKSVIIKILW
jgi:5'-3' exonuclease